MRFTLRALLLLLLLLGFLAAVCFAFPVWLANLVMAPLPLILPGVYTVGLVYGSRATRPFFIGALAPFVMVMLSLGESLRANYYLYLTTLDESYAHRGRNRDLLDNEAIFVIPDEATIYYLEATFLLLCSLVAGVICLGLCAVLWKDRGEG